MRKTPFKMKVGETNSLMESARIRVMHPGLSYSRGTCSRRIFIIDTLKVKARNFR